MQENIQKKITLLSGGTGTPKLILGLRQIISDENLTIIGNTGDDEYFYGLLISPDIDTLIYLFANELDQDKFWGIKDESYVTLKQLIKMKEEIWFQLGDKDLALHLLRNELLKQGLEMDKIIQEICKRFEIKATILPMSNDKISTIMYTENDKQLSFQEYTVKMKEKISIKKVVYQGTDNAETSDVVIESILNADAIIIGPSNPITSILPILSVRNIKDALLKTKAKIIAISPLEEGKAFSGPAAKLLAELGYEASSFGIANLYKEFLNVIIISENDRNLIKRIENLGIKIICTNISLKNNYNRKKLSEIILKEIINSG
ncbi:MAG TPA: 2-phospho-L-lactate transferase [candidate division Zixibacteria bacterium]|nr:2-phospho-L-lactate transferase [candidate division Zixibacteria bacterium]